MSVNKDMGMVEAINNDKLNNVMGRNSNSADSNSVHQRIAGV